MFYSKRLESLIVHDVKIISKPLWIGFEFGALC